MTGFFGVDMPEKLYALDAPPGAPGRGGRPRRQDARPPPAALWWAYNGGSADECCELALAALAGDDLIVARQRPDDDGGAADAGAGRPLRGGRGVGDGAGRGAPPRLAARRSRRSTCGTASRCSSTASWRTPRSRCGRGRRSSTRGGSARSRASTPARSSHGRCWSAARLDEARVVARARAPRAGRELGGQPLLACGASSSCWSPRAATRRRSPRTRTTSAATRTSQLPTATFARSHAARALDRLGRTDEAIALVESELADARRWGAPGTVGPALRVLGLLRREEGTALLEEAVTVLERSHARLELAKALADLGAALRRGAAPERRARAAPARARAGRRVRRGRRSSSTCAASCTRRGARPRTTALGGVDALTASERRVAAFAADGQSNRDIAQALFVTPKTVEVHLEQRLPKARHPLPPRARRSAVERLKDWGRRLGVTPMAFGAGGSILCA